MSSGEILSSPAQRKIFDLINANIIKVYLNCEDTEEEDCDIIVGRPESSCGGGTAPQDIEDMPSDHEDDGDTITRPGLNTRINFNFWLPSLPPSGPVSVSKYPC